MHLERDIIEGRIHSKNILVREAKEELGESKKGRMLEKALENKKKGKPFKHIKGHDGKDLI